jgi:PhnB protein
MAVPHIPEGYHAVTPYLVIRDATKAIEFYGEAFGAVESMRLTMPDGRIGHAEMRIGDSVIMIADEFPEMGFRSPQSLGGTPVHFMVYVEDVDTAFQKAVDAGCTPIRPVDDQFYGDRNGMLEDPFGHGWTLATHIEDLSQDEVQTRFMRFLESQAEETEG